LTFLKIENFYISFFSNEFSQCLDYRDLCTPTIALSSENCAAPPTETVCNWDPRKANDIDCQTGSLKEREGAERERRGRIRLGWEELNMGRNKEKERKCFRIKFL
jgi:hypothetical protein